MSDVLRRLASRVLPGAGDIVRPRLRSRFEGRPGPADALDPGPAAPGPDVSAAVAPAVSPPLFGDTAPRPAALAAVAVAGAAPREARPAPVRRKAAAGAPDPSAPSPDPVAQAPRPDGAGRAAAAAAAPVSAERAAGAPGPPADALAHADGEAGPGSEPPPAPLLLPELRQAEAADAFVAGEAPGRDGALPPDIRISIGRIEVRAGGEPRPTPRPRARTRPTLMSLEDYLGKGRSRQ